MINPKTQKKGPKMGRVRCFKNTRTKRGGGVFNCSKNTRTKSGHGVLESQE